MKLSVIIISYNEEQYLKQSIESVLRQDIADMEIIIGDDGSSDNSLSIIKEYARQQNVNYFVMDRKESDIFVPSYRVSNVIKRAFSLAKGEYIAFVDSDDFVEADYLETLRQGFAQAAMNRPSSARAAHHPFWDG